ncbi:hypothetical protein L345_04156, partial [Ophiophagus hannah]
MLMIWFQVATELELELWDDRMRPEWRVAPRKSLERLSNSSPRACTAQPTMGPSSKGQLLCFHCRKPGHCIACCPKTCPVTTVAAGSQQRSQKTPPKSQEKSRAAQEPCSPMLAGEVETAVRTTWFPDTSGSDDKGELDPTLSISTQPFSIPMMLTSGKRCECQVLMDTGCTHCLISVDMANRLGVKTQKLPQPMKFEQMDGFLLGGRRAIHVMERLTLEIGPHWEVLQFIVVPRIRDDMVL